MALIVHQLAVIPEDIGLPGACSFLEEEDRLRVEQVIFAVFAPLVLAAPVEITQTPLSRRVGTLVMR